MCSGSDILQYHFETQNKDHPVEIQYYHVKEDYIKLLYIGYLLSSKYWPFTTFGFGMHYGYYVL